MSETSVRRKRAKSINIFVRRVGIALLCWMAVESALTEPDPQAGFPVPLLGTRVRHSSISLGDLNQDGIPDIVVGTTDGKVHAYTGNATRLWEYDTGDMAIDSKPAIGDVDGDGYNEVVIGAGSFFTQDTDGGLYVIDHLGNLQCSFQTNDTNSDGFRDGVFSSPALADLDGNDGGLLEIAFGAWDRRVRVLNHDCSVVWDNNVYDTVSSSPAIGDINRDGQPDVVIGVASDDDEDPTRPQGGELHVFAGADGTELPGFPTEINEVISSSPGLGDLTGDGWLEIVVGTGYCWANPDCAPGDAKPGVGEFLNAWDHNGNPLPGWPVPVPGTYAFASPALADLDNDGQLEVIINTRTNPDSDLGMVYALEADGNNVSPGWPTQPTAPAGVTQLVHTSTEASPVVADVTGDGNLEVILPCNFDLVVWDKDGNQLTRDAFPPPPGDLVLESMYRLAPSAAVGDVDGDGDLEVLIGSATDITGTTGAIYAWDFSGPAYPGALPWPMFRFNAANQGNDVSIFADGFESGDTSAWSSKVP